MNNFTPLETKLLLSSIRHSLVAIRLKKLNHTDLEEPLHEEALESLLYTEARYEKLANQLKSNQ